MRKLIAMAMMVFCAVSLNACGIKGNLVRPSDIKKEDHAK